MEDKLHLKTFPGESEEYRQKRNELLVAEARLTAEREKVAALRRELPLGGSLKTDYIFEEGAKSFKDFQTTNQVRLSELFQSNQQELILINFMFSPDNDVPCPMCNMWADGYNAIAEHLSNVVSFALIAKAPIQKLRSHACSRGWSNIRLLSSFNNTFNRDYHAESDKGQIPSITVFYKKEDGKIYHSYSIEQQFLSAPRDPRHIDLYSPVWNLMDLTRQGRPANWYPKIFY